MIRQIKAFIQLNSRQAIRDRFFLGIVFFFILFIAAAAFFSLLSVGHSAEVLRSMALAGIEYTAILLVIVSIAWSFFREKDTRITDVYLSLFSRTAYISGKMLSYMVLSFVYILLGALLSSLLLWLYEAFDPLFLTAFYPLWLKICLVVSLICLCSVFFSSPVTAIFAVLFIYIAGEGVMAASQIVFFHGSGLQKAAVQVLSWFLPRMDLLRAANRGFSLPYFWAITGYSVCYIVWIWSITVFLFQKKDV